MFSTIPKSGFHAPEALEEHPRDATPDVWHSKHMKVCERKVQTVKAVKGMKAVDETGGPCDMRLGVVENARVYPSCNPISEHGGPGWYGSLN